ncbi:MAG: DUF2442 domain-containing protein [Defluviitaleaceae bacterium]|nr:DUF2442 domain-containing protein [Defluviitaleaceae bacterium]
MDVDKIQASPLGPRVTAVSALKGYQLAITFNNDEMRIFDATPLLTLEAFTPLRDCQIFREVVVAYGSLSWPNDIDYCPDTLYAQSIPMKD